MKCPVCHSLANEPFYEVSGVPVHSAHLLHERELARAFPQHHIHLCHCTGCGFIFNSKFDERRLLYQPGYDGSQSHSPHFRQFHRKLSNYLVGKFHLNNKHILEVGCGQGEFLQMLCEGKRNRGLGFDPAFPGRATGTVELRNRLFPLENEKMIDTDLAICKMTLEHIADPRTFLARFSRGFRPSTPVFFQVPDTDRILHEAAFWDIYYEHCSYFCGESLQRLFQEESYDIGRVWTGFADQYLMLEGVFQPNSRKLSELSGNTSQKSLSRSDSLNSFATRVSRSKQKIQETLMCYDRVLFWGAGSKSVALLHALGEENPVLGAVDVNPAKWSTYLAGSGLPVFSPKEVPMLAADLILVMNPIYLKEICETLERLEVEAKVTAVS